MWKRWKRKRARASSETEPASALAVMDEQGPGMSLESAYTIVDTDDVEEHEDGRETEEVATVNHVALSSSDSSVGVRAIEGQGETEEVATADDVARATYDSSPLPKEGKEYASYLMRKAGVDFEAFRHADLADQLGGLISPFDHLIAFLFGAVPGFLLTIGIWYVFFYETAGNTPVVMFLFACMFGAVFAVVLGVIVDLIRSFRAVMHVIDLSVVAARSVRNESKNVGIEAFRRLSKDEIATGISWIVVMPIVTATLRKRLKVRWVSAPVIGFLEMVLRVMFPLEVPEDAEAQIAALPPIAAQDRLTPAEELSLLAHNPVATMTSAADKKLVDQDWIGFLERSRPKVLNVARKTRNAVMLPLIGIAVLLLAFMIGGAALIAHFMV